MVEDFYGRVIESGFLVVLRFDALYSKYAQRYQLVRDLYALPRIDRSWSECPVKYRGTDRDALKPFSESSSPAEVFMAEIEEEGRCIDGVLRTSQDMHEVLRRLGADASRYEPIWVRQLGTHEEVPDGFSLLGIEPSYFIGDHFSASCDCMMIGRWHGTDEEHGTLFLDHFRRLNPHGLFRSASDAWQFFDYYCSLDWTENDRSQYVMVEVFGQGESGGA